MLLESRGIGADPFVKLQDLAIQDTKTADNSLADFRAFIAKNSLGRAYRLRWLIEKLQGLGVYISLGGATPSIDTPFLRRLRTVGMKTVLRDIRHSARIPIPGSYLLVGVADEGVAYQKRGYEKVFTLRAGEIYGTHSLLACMGGGHSQSSSMCTRTGRTRTPGFVRDLHYFAKSSRSSRRW